MRISSHSRIRRATCPGAPDDRQGRCLVVTGAERKAEHELRSRARARNEMRWCGVLEGMRAVMAAIAAGGMLLAGFTQPAAPAAASSPAGAGSGLASAGGAPERAATPAHARHRTPPARAAGQP